MYIYIFYYFVSFSQKTDGDFPTLNLGELDLTTDEFILDEVDGKKQLLQFYRCNE